MRETRTIRRHAGALSPRRRLARILAALAAVCYLIGVMLTAWLAWNIGSTELAVRAAADHTIQTQAAWPAKNQESILEQAKVYNRTLTATGTGVLPVGGDGTSGGRGDAAYMRALDTGNGSMAVLEIPSISLKQPIYHTTDDDALESGVGHVYGTALPLGENGTHAALAAHTGTGTRTDFTRIRELKEGGFFYVTVLGKTMGYRVDRIQVVDPDDFKAITDTKPDEARITLVTCTPPVLNTQRLLVSGIRMDIPDPVPPAFTQKDDNLHRVALAIGIIIAGLTLPAVMRAIRRRRERGRTRTRHRSA